MELLTEGLYPTVEAKIHPKFYDRVCDSVKKEGFHYPLVLWQTTAEEWRVMHSGSPETLCPPEDLPPDETVLLVMCGNNRLKIAKELGLIKVPVIVKKDREEISRLCEEQRRNWRVRLRSLIHTENQKTQ